MSTATVATGAKFEIVYDWTKDRCELWDIPDAPLRAFKNYHDQIVAFASDDRNRPFVGGTLDDIRHSCRSALHSDANPDPAAYDDHRWLASTLTLDGKTVFGLVHDEYHANEHDACRFKDLLPCWYNTVVAVRSVDGGTTFEQSFPPIIVAGSAYTQDVDQGSHRGFFSPSNVVTSQGYYYVLIGTTGFGNQRLGTCLFRTDHPEVQTSWRAWDGEHYASKAINPYDHPKANYSPCVPVQGLPPVVGSLVWWKAANAYLAVSAIGPSPEHPSGAIVQSWSKDLLHWNNVQILLDLPTINSRQCSDAVRLAFPSVIDPKSGDRNFSTVDDAPYLYFTQIAIDQCRGGPARDLVRVRLQLHQTH